MKFLSVFCAFLIWSFLLSVFSFSSFEAARCWCQGCSKRCSCEWGGSPIACSWWKNWGTKLSISSLLLLLHFSVNICVSRYGESMAVPKHRCQKRTLESSILEIATLFCIPTTLVIRRRTTTYAGGLGRIVLRWELSQLCHYNY